MPYKNIWMVPNQTKVPKHWSISSSAVLAGVGAFSKLWAEWLNKVNVHNQGTLFNAIEKRDPDQGLVTVSNHYSCMDDPILWGTLKWRHLMRKETMRWTLGATDICFTRYLSALFFCLGQTIPVTRGHGVYQYSLDFMIEQLNKGNWLHIFPEGKVNLSKEFMRLKWGVGRIIADCKRAPVVLPLYHFGMDDILPNEPPYIPRIRKKVTLLVGDPMDFSGDLKFLREMKRTPREIRKHITDKVQEELQSLKVAAEIIHRPPEAIENGDR